MSSMFADCAGWLSGTGTTSATQAINYMLDTPGSGATGVTVGVGNVSGGANAVEGSNVPGVPSGTLMTIAINGAFFQPGSSATVGYGVPNWITGGSLAAQMLLVIHELAHAVEAPGFNPNDNGNPAAQTANNSLVMKNCGDVISWWAGKD